MPKGRDGGRKRRKREGKGKEKEKSLAPGVNTTLQEVPEAFLTFFALSFSLEDILKNKKKKSQQKWKEKITEKAYKCYTANNAQVSLTLSQRDGNRLTERQREGRQKRSELINI